MQSLIETHAWELHPGAFQHVLAHRINGYALAAAAAVWNDHRRSQAQRCPRTKPFQTDIAVFHAFQVLVKVGDKTPAHSAYPVHAGWGLGFFATQGSSRNSASPSGPDQSDAGESKAGVPFLTAWDRFLSTFHRRFDIRGCARNILT